MLLSILEMTNYNTERVNDFPHLSKLKRKKESATLILGRVEQTSAHSSWESSTDQRLHEAMSLIEVAYRNVSEGLLAGAEQLKVLPGTSGSSS